MTVTHPKAIAMLNSQIFIELVRNGMPEKALAFGRKCILSGNDIAKTGDLFQLLAYKNTEDSEVLQSFLSMDRRYTVYKEVNIAVRERMERRMCHAWST